MKPMPRRPSELANPMRDLQTCISKIPPNSASATDKGKTAQFATKVKEKYKRNDPYTSLRKLEKKDTTTKTIY